MLFVLQCDNLGYFKKYQNTKTELFRSINVQMLYKFAKTVTLFKLFYSWKFIKYLIFIHLKLEKNARFLVIFLQAHTKMFSIHFHTII